MSSPAFDVDRLLDDPGIEIIVCCGSGGVGKTTTAAALGVRAAERGRRVVVLTIDPARRLAQSLGIDQLDNTPRPVRELQPAVLSAAMLDMKSTFDEVVLSQATPELAEQILNNPFYMTLSTSFAGTQEYMAMEKLGQLYQQARDDDAFDLIVVDTPPARSALDFLDAPQRLSNFLDGRVIRILSAPARGPLKLMTAGLGLVTSALTKVIGASLLVEAQRFIAAFDTLFGGFRARADATYALLKAPSTAFVVVAAPEPDALREASYFIERLHTDAMPLAGAVINRCTPVPDGELDASAAIAAAQRLHAEVPDSVTAGLLTAYAERALIASREAVLRAEFGAAHPAVPIALVPALAGDVHDLAGLREVGNTMAG